MDLNLPPPPGQCLVDNIFSKLIDMAEYSNEYTEANYLQFLPVKVFQMH